MRHTVFWSLDRWGNRKPGRFRTWPQVTQWGSGRARIWSSSDRTSSITPAQVNCIHSRFLLSALTLCFPLSSTEFLRGGGGEKPKKIRKCLDMHFISSSPLSSLSFFLFCWKARGKRTWHHFHHVDSSGFLKCCDPWKARIHAYLHSSLRRPRPRDRDGRLLVQWVGMLNNTRTTAGAALVRMPGCLSQSVLARYLALAHLLQNSQSAEDHKHLNLLQVTYFNYILIVGLASSNLGLAWHKDQTYPTKEALFSR